MGGYFYHIFKLNKNKTKNISRKKKMSTLKEKNFFISNLDALDIRKY